MTICEFFRHDLILPVLNRHGIEQLLSLRPFIVRNACTADYYRFTPDELVKIDELFVHCQAIFEENNILDFLKEEKVRKILNWRGLESKVGMQKQRIFTTAVSGYPLLDEEKLMLTNYFDFFFRLRRTINYS